VTILAAVARGFSFVFVAMMEHLIWRPDPPDAWGLVRAIVGVLALMLGAGFSWELANEIAAGRDPRASLPAGRDPEAPRSGDAS
jgi:hypothetical protein